MKKIIISITCIFIIFFGIYYFIGLNKNITKNEKETKKTIKKEETYTNLVSSNGMLSIKDNNIVNEKGDIFILKGMSSHGIQWFSDLITKENIKYLKENYNSNLFRIAMYTNENGYIQNKELKQKAMDIMDMVIDLDMYVIIDWHILSDNDPLMYKNEAIEFFDEISKKYKDYPNVLYEICNEPNGNVTWQDNIKPYAIDVIKTIRKNTDNIIIVGTPTWSQDVDIVSNDPIEEKNIMYSLHFYSGTHTDYLRDKAKTALLKIPIFISEFGISDASGNGGIFIEEANKWIEFMKDNNLSWANWSLTNKNESSAFLKENTFIINEDNLSESGKYISEIMKGY